MKTNTLLDFDTELKTLCKKVSQLTEDNQHTDARLEIAKYFKLKSWIGLFSAINKIHTIEGSMPQQINEYRVVLTKDMLKYIECIHGTIIKNQISRCL